MECNFEMLLCNQNGCTTVVPREEFKDHLESRCLFSIIPCPEPNCNEKTQRRLMDSHIETCGHVKTICPNSNLGYEVQVERCAMNEHCFTTCKYRLVTCEFCSSSVVEHELDIHTNCCPGVLITCETCGMSEARSCFQDHECVLSLQNEIKLLKEIFGDVDLELFENMLVSSCSNGKEHHLVSLLHLDQCAFDKNRGPSNLHCFKQKCLRAACENNNHQIVKILLDKNCIQVCDVQEILKDEEVDWDEIDPIVRKKLERMCPTLSYSPPTTTTSQLPQRLFQKPIGIPVSDTTESNPTYILNSMGKYLFKDIHGRWAVRYNYRNYVSSYWLLTVCSSCGYAKPNVGIAVSAYFPRFSATFDVPENQPRFTCGRCCRSREYDYDYY